MIKNIFFLVILLLSTWLSVHAQLNQFDHFRFIENKGQHPSDGLFISPFPGGEMIIRETSLFYHFHDANKEKEVLEQAHEGVIDTTQIDHHSFVVDFLGADKATIVGKDSLIEVRNYLKGNDPSKWVQKVRAFQQIDYLNIYPNTDLSIFQKNGKTKYEFVAKPGSKPKKIRLQYSGTSKIYLNGEQLVIQTTLGNVIEDAPFAYQIIGDKRVEVACQYVLKDSTLRYKLGKYDKNYPLVIDPKLIFSTSSGSLADNWGNTACYDRRGNLYTGGTLFEASSAGGTTLRPNGFPTTLGAFQRTFQGGDTDMGIMKFDSSGTFLQYSTIIGGSDAEIPTSTVVNENNELYILGITSSMDFPVTSGAYNTTFSNSATEITWLVNGVPAGNGDTFNTTTLNPDDQVQAVYETNNTCSNNRVVNSNIITMKQPPQPKVKISTGGAFCPGDAVTFNATTTHSLTPSFQWLLNGVPVGSDIANYTHITPVVGDSVQVIVTDGSCNPTLNSDTSEVVVLFLASDTSLSVSIASDSLPLCSGGRYTFSAETNFNDPSRLYSWKVNDIEQTTDETFTTTLLNDGDNIHLEVTSSLSCSPDDTVSSNIITVNNAAQTVTPEVFVTASNYSDCDDAVTLSATTRFGGNNQLVRWAIQGSDFFLPSTPGTSRTLSRELLNNNSLFAVLDSRLGCASPTRVFSPLIQLPEQNTRSIAFDIEVNTDTLCSGNNVSFTAITDDNSSQVTTPVGGYSFNHRTDIVVIHLSADGTAVLDATFVGGKANDGLIETNSDLTNNYGDQLRGDINLDSLGNVYVASSSSSVDFPVVNAVQPTYGGGQTDGVVFKMNPTLSTMIFSTYLGGVNNDAAFSVQTNRAHEVYVGGGTISTNFPTTPGSLHANPLGNVDGFITHLSTDGNAIINSTRLGTPQFDQTYFIQLDTNNNVYALGQTKGDYPVFKSKYSNPNSGLFIQKLSPNMSTSVYSTVFGDLAPGNTVLPNISPTAFLVNECENVFISGWGGASNNFFVGLSQPDTVFRYQVYNGGNTFNMPITTNSFQTTTDGSDFYLAALSKNADSLIYSTYFGGPTSEEHVDGGTSRFDFRGIVYQSVCSGCRGFRDFPTEPDDGSDATYPKRNLSQNCNNGVFKFDLATLIADFEVPDSCLSREVTFKNTSSGGIDFTWDFGDGNSAFNPILEDQTHTYQFPGFYEVMLIATDLTTCVGKDTASTTIYIPELLIPQHYYDTICEGSTASLNLTTSGAEDSFQWSPPTDLDDTTIPNPMFSGSSSAQYLITVKDTSLCEKVDTFDIAVLPILEANFSANTDCNFGKIILNNESVNGKLFEWDFGDGNIDTTYTLNPFNHAYKSKGFYSISLKAINDSTCNKIDYASNIIVQIRDSLAVEKDTTICKFNSVQLQVTQGVNPIWESSPTLSCTNCLDPIASPLETTTYYVSITEDTCVDRDSVTVTIYPDNNLLADIEAEVPRCYTDTVYFRGTINNNDCICCSQPKKWLWDFGDGGASEQKNPTHKYNAEGPYDVSLTIFTNTDTASVSYSLSIYHPDSCLKNIFIPNAFSPNDDLSNDILYVRAINITELEFRLFNRWGEEVFYTKNKNKGWDGIYKGTKMSPQVFTYTCRATFWDGEPFYQEGNVTLLE